MSTHERVPESLFFPQNVYARVFSSMVLPTGASLCEGRLVEENGVLSIVQPVGTLRVLGTLDAPPQKITEEQWLKKRGRAELLGADTQLYEVALSNKGSEPFTYWFALQK